MGLVVKPGSGSGGGTGGSMRAGGGREDIIGLCVMLGPLVSVSWPCVS